MLHSKKDFQKCLVDMLSPLRKHYTTGKAGLKCGYTGVQYGEKTALLEAFARPLWGLAPLWGGKGDAEGFSDIYVEGIINGTNPEHEEYWGQIRDREQRIVELAPIGLALILAPDKIWNPLTPEQKERFSRWLWRINEVECPDNNWLFFAVLVNLGLKNVGERYDKAVIDNAITRVNSFYKGNGWYTDGNTEQIDYYVGFAFHFYGLIYAKVMEKEDPRGSKLFKDRAMLFAKDFIYWFDSDGSALAFGRSLTYRFAQVSFWSACIFAGIEPFPLGVIKGIIVRHLEYWLSKPIFDSGGVLTIGYAYPNLNMCEDYNAYGSPYWALKAFLLLAVADDHEFFKAEPLPLPELEELHIIPQAKMVIQRINGYVVALTGGQWIEWPCMHLAEKYSKFAYSSKYAFSVPRSYEKLISSGTDSMLAFEKDDMIYVRKRCIASITEDGILNSEWSPCKGIKVKTIITPTAKGHNREHIAECDFDCVVYDCGFATADGGGRVAGAGEAVTIKCTPNTNLVCNEPFINAVKYNLKKGKNIISTTVEYPD